VQAAQRVEPFRPSLDFYFDLRDEVSATTYLDSSADSEYVANQLLGALSRVLRADLLGSRIREENEARSAVNMTYSLIHSMMMGRW
jgi:hypothetical protein